MIKTMKHAEQVQNRRYEKGLRGVSKAVRRFLKREYPNYPIPEDAFQAKVRF